jgi:alpha-beta hydrolase superfamily lysophospholipase
MRKTMAHYEFERMAFDGLKLYFQCWQTDQDQKGIICLVHGLGEHSGRYTHWAGLLNQAGYSVLTYDLRGHGKSEGQRGHIFSFNEFIEDSDLLLEEATEYHSFYMDIVLVQLSSGTMSCVKNHK